MAYQAPEALRKATQATETQKRGVTGFKAKWKAGQATERHLKSISARAQEAQRTTNQVLEVQLKGKNRLGGPKNLS